MKIIEGVAYIAECSNYFCEEGSYTHGDVRNDKEHLSDILEELEGKKLKITIEVVE